MRSRERGYPLLWSTSCAWKQPHHRAEAAFEAYQAIRIGELGIAAMPNEVFGSTGLAIKAQSPLKPTFSIELANGYAGYLPPPEQHALGGYTTWRARSSCLEEQAEPKIRAKVLEMLRDVAGCRADEAPMLSQP